VAGTDCIGIFNFNKYSGDQIKNIWRGEVCGAYGEWKGANGVLMGSRPLGKSKTLKGGILKKK